MLKNKINFDDIYEQMGEKFDKDAYFEKGLAYDAYRRSFTAEFCNATGLMKIGFRYENHREYLTKYLSRTRCQKLKKPIKKGEVPVAFGRVRYGFAALYDRSEFEDEIIARKI